MPQTTDDTDDNVEEAEDRTTRQMEETARRRNKGELGKGNREKHATTWATPGGNVRWEIDNITIRARRRSMTGKEQINIYWNADMNQNQQQREQKRSATTMPPRNTSIRYQRKQEHG